MGERNQFPEIENRADETQGFQSEAPMAYLRRILRSGVSVIWHTGDRAGRWIKHDDPDFLAWLGSEGYSCLEELPAEEDYRDGTTCERCGAQGVEVHHWAPAAWFGPEESERWPKADLCRPCHIAWHQAADRAAAVTTLRRLRHRKLYQLAARIESALTDEAPGLPLGFESVPIVEPTEEDRVNLATPEERP